MKTRGSKTKTTPGKDPVHSPVAQDEAATAQIAMLNDMLETVNAHLAATLRELEAVKADLQKVTEFVEVAAVLVNTNLHIRHFTPPMTTICNISANDIGRPLAAVAGDFTYDEFEADFQRAGETKTPIEKRVETGDGKARFIMRIVPFVARNDAADGAAIVFTEVDG